LGPAGLHRGCPGSRGGSPASRECRRTGRRGSGGPPDGGTSGGAGDGGGRLAGAVRGGGADRAAAAVDGVDAPGDPVGLVAGEEEGEGGDVLDRAEAAERVVACGGGVGLRHGGRGQAALLPGPLHQRGIDPARADRVDADVVGGVGGGHLPGDGDDAALGGGVGEDAGDADEAADAGLVDDDAAAALHHVRQRVPGGQPDALEVDGDDPVPLLLGGVGGVAGAGDARVGEDDVDPVEAGEGLLGHPFGVGGGGDVGGQGDGGAAGLADLLGDPAGRVRVEVDA